MNRFIIILFLGLISCNSNKPRNLDEAINYFEKNWNKKEKAEFLSDSLKNAHMSIGMWIRNNWIHGNRDTALVTYFNNLGIHAADDMSSIILTSLFRKLNNKPIDLEEQVKYYKAYWKPIIECFEKQRMEAWQKSKPLKIGNPVRLYLEVDTTNGGREVTGRECPDEDWTFDPNKDVLVNGILVDKYYLGDTANVFVKIKILSINQKDIPWGKGPEKVGDTAEISLKASFKIE